MIEYTTFSFGLNLQDATRRYILSSRGNEVLAAYRRVSWRRFVLDGFAECVLGDSVDRCPSVLTHPVLSHQIIAEHSTHKSKFKPKPKPTGLHVKRLHGSHTLLSFSAPKVSIHTTRWD